MAKLETEKIKSILDKKTSINSETNCWEYLGVNSDGYGQVTIDYQFYYTHVLSAMIHFGYIPTNVSMICHKSVCRSKSCWNPEHLYVGDARTNNNDIREAGNYRGRFSNATHCVNGHELTSSNTYWSKRRGTKEMRRQCRACRRIRDRQYKNEKKESVTKLSSVKLG